MMTRRVNPITLRKIKNVPNKKERVMSSWT